MDNHKPFLEVVNTEKELLGLIYSKGILDDEVLRLNRKIRTRYEEFLLKNDNVSVESHEIEYHLWKLHYKLIDKFRKIVRQRSSSSNTGKPRNNIVDNYQEDDAYKTLEKFKSFLSESADFYIELIVKLRKNYGFPAEIFLRNDDHGRLLLSVEPTKLHTCQYLCHRLLVCLGDLVRYNESYTKSDAPAWLEAAKYYMEASKICPDSGNPHNQLALLATYVGDHFLALYHLVRSLAVKEPFHDAWRNILLLFEESRSTKLPSTSSQIQFNFLNPSEKVSLHRSCNEKNRSHQTGELYDFEKLESWPLLVRSISFLLIRSSLEEFPSTFATAVLSLEALLEQNDTELFASLESYQRLNSSKKGPYRAIQLVSIFIFVFHNLTKKSETEKSKAKDNKSEDAEVKSLAITATFICMGRLIERCMKRNDQNKDCPLLPAVLVFLEWLVQNLGMLESLDGDDKRAVSSLSYFFVALIDLSKRMDRNGNEIASDDIKTAAVWEDHELRGFNPLIHDHETLNFSTDPGFANDSFKGYRVRVERLFRATSRILESSRSCQKVVSIDELGRLLNSLTTTLNLVDQGEAGSETNQETEPNSIPKVEQHATIEEEEVIVFKPITRCNSEPIYTSNVTKKSNTHTTEMTTKSTIPEIESLRRATSLYTNSQNQVNDSSFSFHHKENPFKDSPRPPSLSAWVPLNIMKEKTPVNFKKEKLIPIEETTSMPFSEVYINPNPTITRATPIPSATFLLDNAVWLADNSLISPNYYRSGITGNEGDGILGAAPSMGYASRDNLIPGIPNLIDNYCSYPPPTVGMSSSEWLYHYRNGTQNLATNHMPPLIHLNGPVFGNEISGFDSYDQWGNRLVTSPINYLGSPQVYLNSSSSSYVYGVDHHQEHKRDKGFLGYERSFPYMCGVGMEMSNEQPTPLLHYLKEKERQLQNSETPIRVPNFMGI